MSDQEKKSFLLLVQQCPFADPRLDDLADALFEEHGLEKYTVRQRLIGAGLVQFGQGDSEKLAEIAEILRQHEFECWRISPHEPQFDPEPLRTLEIHDDHIAFSSHNKTVRLDRGVEVVGVLADVSGQLHERVVRRHMVKKNFRGIERVATLGLEEMSQAVLKGEPVYDFYLIGKDGRPFDAVRVTPGRYHATGLGDRMRVSSLQNLEVMVNLTREYAGSFTLRADFGLGRLPGCAIRTVDGKPKDGLNVFKSLTRFGWLMCDLLQDRQEPQPESDVINPAIAAAALATGRPALAAAVMSGNDEVLPGLDEISRDMNEAMGDEPASDKPVSQDGPGLPPPPARTEHNRLSFRNAVTLFVLFAFVAVLIALKSGNFWMFNALERLMRAGLAPVVFAILIASVLFWSGFYFVSLKRRIENTPTSRVRSIAMGLVEVHGKAYRKYALVSPVSFAACIYYRLRKYRKDSSEKWILKSDTDSGHVPFYIDDGTGRVTVDPLGATVRAKTSQTGYPGEMTMAFGGVMDAGEDEKWVEHIIYEGTPLYVIGYAHPQREDKPSLRERTLGKLRDLKLDPQAMRRYDADGDGRIDETEWATARSDAEQDALRDHLAERGERKRQEDHVVISRPSQRRLPFVVAETESEAHLTRKYGLASLFLVAAGAVTTAFAIFKLLQYLGT